LLQAISYFTLVSRLRIHGQYNQVYKCLHFINFTNLYLQTLLLLIYFHFISINSFQISDILYEKQESVRFLRSECHILI